MAELSNDQKNAIVTELAMFKRASEVVVVMREQWGIEIDRFQVRAYDPTNARYEAGEQWRVIFEAKRAAYIDEAGRVPIAHQGFRLNLLNDMTLAAMRSGNFVLAAKLLEQAAREVGGTYTSKQTLHIDHSSPRSPKNMSPEERREALTEVIRQAMARRSEANVN